MPSLTHHPAFHFSPRFGRFSFFSKRRRFKKFAPFNFLHDAIAFALAFEPSKRFLNGFTFTNFYGYHS